MNLSSHIFQDKNTRIVPSQNVGSGMTDNELIHTIIGDDFLRAIKDKTPITPNNLKTVTNNKEDFFERHDYPFSGRSFGKGFQKDGKDFELTIKGGHLGGNKIGKNDLKFNMPDNRTPQDHRKLLYGSPLYGSENTQTLLHESTIAKHLQNNRLDRMMDFGPYPIPIQVSNLTHYDIGGNLSEYTASLASLMTKSNYHLWNTLFTIVSNTSKFKKGAYQTVIDHFGNNLHRLAQGLIEYAGMHGSYIYIVQGTNMRLADTFAQGTREDIINRMKIFYPQDTTPIDMCRNFMDRYGQACGGFIGTKTYYKNIGKVSQCHIVDTTILGSIMDIGTYEVVNNPSKKRFIEMVGHHMIAYIETCYTVYKVLIGDESGFMTFFKDSFIKNYTSIFKSLTDHEFPMDLMNHVLTVSEDFLEKVKKDPSQSRLDKKYMTNIIDIVYPEI